MNAQENISRSIFTTAIEQVPPRNWPDFVDQACGEDLHLRSRVRLLLRSHENIGEFMEYPVVSDSFAVSQPVSEKPGAIIGNYRLLQLIGEGGMGVVYRATSIDSPDRQVALKIVKPGIGADQVCNRFDVEVQTLAKMDHPNIASVLDSGTTESGRPYLVMELVDGTPLTNYCDHHLLHPKERLKLFIPICQAVQHAHQKGIIHRDIKPSNVLVTMCDGYPTPKLIDFGVAKCTNPRLTRESMFTQVGQIIGTLEYMSPEQANLGGLDVDTRSDIYSLGVMLYELLTSVTPIDRCLLRSLAFDEIMRHIREEDPPRPSLRLGILRNIGNVAADRQVDPKRLAALLRGDLDWIVMKAIEKDRTRRYETAIELARDIQRHFDDETVVACPPSTVHRLCKFARRNRIALSTAALVSVSLTVGITGTTWQAVRATSQRNRAIQAEENARKQAVRADREAAIAKAVNQFMHEDLLSSAGPNVEPNRDLKVRTVLDRASREIGLRFRDQPLVQAQVHRTLGNVYADLGEYENARLHLGQSRELLEQNRGVSHRETLLTVGALGRVYSRDGEYRLAEQLLAPALDVSLRKYGPDEPCTLSLMSAIASNERFLGHFAESERILRRLLKLRRRLLHSDHPNVLGDMHDLAATLFEQGRYREAESLLMEVLNLQESSLGKTHPRVLKTRSSLACTISHQGRYEEAEEQYQSIMESASHVLGNEHPYTLLCMSNLPLIIREQGRYEEAESLNREVLDALRRVLGAEHPLTLSSMHNLAMIIHDQKRLSESESINRDVLKARRRTFQSNHPDILKSMHNLAVVLDDQNRTLDAQRLHQEVLRVRKQTLRSGHPDTFKSIFNLAKLALEQGNYAEAEELYRELAAGYSQTYGPDHALVQYAEGKLADAIQPQLGDRENKLQATQ